MSTATAECRRRRRRLLDVVVVVEDGVRRAVVDAEERHRARIFRLVDVQTSVRRLRQRRRRNREGASGDQHVVDPGKDEKNRSTTGINSLKGSSFLMRHSRLRAYLLVKGFLLDFVNYALVE